MIKLLISRSKKTFLKSACFVILLSGMQIILPISMRWMISFTEEKQSYIVLTICIFGYAILLLINNFVHIGWTYSLDWLGGEILEGIRMDLYDAILKADYKELLKIGKEKLKNILYMDTLNIFQSVSVQGMQIISNIFLIFIFLLVSFFINQWLSLVLLLSSILGFFLSMASRKPIAAASMKVNLKMKEDNKVTNEYIDAMELLKTNELEYYFREKGKSSLWDFIHTALRADKILVFLKQMITDFHQLVSVGISAFLAMSMRDTVTAGDLVYYIFVTDMILNTSQAIETGLYSLIRMLPAFENITKILHLKETKGTEILSSIDTISFKNVSFYYENNQKSIINNLSAEFKTGDIIRIAGENGSGKSTFIKLLVGLLHPETGEICFNGIPIHELSSSCLKKQIIYINQDEIILNDTVNNYLKAISDLELEDETIEALKNKVKFDKEIVTVRENGNSLSGGQRKKMLLMKLLLRYQGASVIILDEIEAGLDLESKEFVIELEKEILSNRKNCIIFKITHEEKIGFYNKVIQMS